MWSLQWTLVAIAILVSIANGAIVINSPEKNSLQEKVYKKNSRANFQKFRIKRSGRGYARGQTQSQYLNFGNPDQDGKAEAEATEGGSRSTVSGSHGMGQAQSQFSFGDCSDCGSQSYEYPPDPYTDSKSKLVKPGSTVDISGVSGIPQGISAGRNKQQSSATGSQYLPENSGKVAVGPGGIGSSYRPIGTLQGGLSSSGQTGFPSVQSGDSVGGRPGFTSAQSIGADSRSPGSQYTSPTGNGLSGFNDDRSYTPNLVVPGSPSPVGGISGTNGFPSIISQITPGGPMIGTGTRDSSIGGIPGGYSTGIVQPDSSRKLSEYPSRAISAGVDSLSGGQGFGPGGQTSVGNGDRRGFATGPLRSETGNAPGYSTSNDGSKVSGSSKDFSSNLPEYDGQTRESGGYTRHRQDSFGGGYRPSSSGSVTRGRMDSQSVDSGRTDEYSPIPTGTNYLPGRGSPLPGGGNMEPSKSGYPSGASVGQGTASGRGRDLSSGSSADRIGTGSGYSFSLPGTGIRDHGVGGVQYPQKPVDSVIGYPQTYHSTRPDAGNVNQQQYGSSSGGGNSDSLPSSRTVQGPNIGYPSEIPYSGGVNYRPGNDGSSGISDGSRSGFNYGQRTSGDYPSGSIYQPVQDGSEKSGYSKASQPGYDGRSQTTNEERVAPPGSGYQSVPSAPSSVIGRTYPGDSNQFITGSGYPGISGGVIQPGYGIGGTAGGNRDYGGSQPGSAAYPNTVRGTTGSVGSPSIISGSYPTSSGGSFGTGRELIYPGESGGIGTGMGAGTGTGVRSGIGTGIGSGPGTGIGSRIGTGIGPAIGTGIGPGIGPGIGSGIGSGIGAGIGSGYEVGTGNSVENGIAPGIASTGARGGGRGGTGAYGGPANLVGGGVPDDAFSQAESSVRDGQAAASASGKKNGGSAKTQVSGTYSAGGTFSASAMTSDNDRSANAQVSGSSEGAMSQSQGQGGAAQSQSQVQVNARNGGTRASSQSGGLIQQSQSEVQANDKGGLADAQSSGPGQTSSQAQIGFRPRPANDGNIASVGGGQASAQSSAHSGQSQSQIHGHSKFGVSYHGAASSASGTKEQVATYREQNRQLFHSISQFGANDGITDRVETTYNPALHSSSLSNELQLKSISESKPETKLPGDHILDGEEEEQYTDYADGEEDDDDYYNENPINMDGQASTQKSAEATPPDDEGASSVPSFKTYSQQTSGQNQKAIVVIDPKEKFTIVQKQNGRASKHSSRTTTETIPDGFRGTVNIEKKFHTKSLETHVETEKYKNSNSTTGEENKSQVSKEERRTPNSYVTVTKSVTGSLDTSKDPPTEKKKFQSTYYTKSSTCGYFTFSCNIVYGANGRSKICRPKAPANGKC